MGQSVDRVVLDSRQDVETSLFEAEAQAAGAREEIHHDGAGGAGTQAFPLT